MPRTSKEWQLVAASGPELRFDEVLHHDCDLIGRQRRIDLAENLDGLVGVLIDELRTIAPRRLDGPQLVRPFLDCLAGCHAELRRNKRQILGADEDSVFAFTAAGAEENERD